MITPLAAARACQLAYERIDIEVGGARALVNIGTEEVLVAFQGTHDFHQVLADLDVRPRFTVGVGYSPHGFSVLAEQIYPRIVQLAREYALPLALAGHSLGGAEAVLVGARMIRDGIAPARVYAFGCPRVSWGHAVGRVYRQARVRLGLWRYGADIVPDLPPGYWHATNENQIGTPSDGIDAGERDHAIARYIEGLEMAA